MLSPAVELFTYNNGTHTVSYIANRVTFYIMLHPISINDRLKLLSLSHKNCVHSSSLLGDIDMT